MLVGRVGVVTGREPGAEAQGLRSEKSPAATRRKGFDDAEQLFELRPVSERKRGVTGYHESLLHLLRGQAELGVGSECALRHGERVGVSPRASRNRALAHS